jgi:large subunit ribosomal protein L10
VLAAKRLSDAARRSPALQLKGGFMEGRLLSAEEARALATLESRETMLSQIAGLAKMEMSRAASMFQALQGRFVGLLDAYRDKLPGEAEPAPAESGAAAAPEGPETTATAEGTEAGDAAEEPAAAEAPASETSQSTDEAPSEAEPAAEAEPTSAAEAEAATSEN